MQITVDKTTDTRIFVTIEIDGKIYKEQIVISSVKAPMSDFCNVQEMLPLFLVFWAKTQNVSTIPELAVKVASVKEVEK